ncbi:PLDc N-terminal domain-containing protein [Flavobacterium sp. CAU 1735]|uniref:PLDc N-terminal domain-containing protein n=1 Tax=Flavobacterium sp. CAU 1735 TaxID=3140361 RepID=UPI00326059C4
MLLDLCLQMIMPLLAAFIIFSLFRLSKSRLESDRKIIWCILILAFPVLGSLAYFIVGNK